MAISRTLRFQILRRDNNTCRYCGRSAPEVKLTIDHVVPTTLGGTDDPGNLVTACEECNGGKSAIPPDAALVSQVADDAVRWSAAVRAAAGKALADLERRKADRAAFLSAWEQWRYVERSQNKTIPLPPDWAETVDRFVALGLPLEILLDAVPVAMTRRAIEHERKFNYLCGIAWKKLRKIQDEARSTFGQGRDDADDEDFSPHDRCRAFSREELAIELFYDAFQSRSGLFDEARKWARAELAEPPEERIFPEEASEVVLTAREFIEQLDSGLWKRDFVIRKFLEEVPKEIREQAIENAKADYYKANWNPVDDDEFSSDVLRHVGHILYGYPPQVSLTDKPPF